MKLKIRYIIYILVFAPVNILADTIPQTYFGLHSHYGFIIPHSRSIEPVSHTNPFGFGISYNKLHISYPEWKVFNAYWASGIEGRYFNFQNPDVLGSVFDLSLFAEPVICFARKYFITVRGGAGFSYHNLVYDPEDNPLNLFFSTKINFPLYLNLRFKYKIQDRTFITLSACYNHISNGGFKQPNKGMNFPTLSLGVEHSNTMIPALNHNFSPDPDDRNTGLLLTVQTLASVKVLSEYEGFDEKTAFIYGFHARVSKSLGYIYSINTGAEMIFDGYIRETIERENLGYDYKRFALTFGQDFLFGRIIFTQYFGFYLYSPYKARNPIYQKYELLYRIREKTLVGVYLKAHAHVAELMGISLNYQLLWKK